MDGRRNGALDADAMCQCVVAGVAVGGHLIPFSFFHEVTFTGLPCMHVVIPWCAVPLNWMAVPDFGTFPLKKRL